MRRIVFSLAVALSSTATAQVRDVQHERSGLPRDVAREATRLYNESSGLRTTGRVDIEESRTVDGDVAVLEGPVFISGRVRGRVVAINSDVVLRSTARIEGDLLVVGGEVEGRHAAFVGGEIRIYRQELRYEQVGDRILPIRSTTASETGWWQRWERSYRRSSSKFYIATAGAYNRVEGLPINLGPQVSLIAPWGSVRLDAYAIVRTETSFDGDQDDIGHNVSTEVRLGRRGGVLVGGKLYNNVEPTETWQLSQGEAGLAAFLMRRDYRDYYERRGGRIHAGMFVRRGADVTVSYGEERWGSRGTEVPWTLFMQGASWRPNPAFDAGRLQLLNTTLRVDTRNDDESPLAGWYVLADIEHGSGDIDAFAPRSAPLATPAAPTDLQYTRGFLDFRRYNRVSPGAQLNFRVVTGGWLNGDAPPPPPPPPLDGPGGIPGFDFRTPSAMNTLTCTTGGYDPGIPGQCDRMALAQLEFRGDLQLDFFNDWHDDDYMRSVFDGVWVFFADAGRGWLVGPSSDDEMTCARDELPGLATYRADLGVGLDLELFGVYVAKSISDPSENPNFFVRVRHRF